MTNNDPVSLNTSSKTADPESDLTANESRYRTYASNASPTELMEPRTLCLRSTVLTIEKKCARRKKVSEWAHHFPTIVVNVDIFGNPVIRIFA